MSSSRAMTVATSALGGGVAGALYGGIGAKMSGGRRIGRGTMTAAGVGVALGLVLGLVAVQSPRYGGGAGGAGGGGASW